jgi:hypothetical protein
MGVDFERAIGASSAWRVVLRQHLYGAGWVFRMIHLHFDWRKWLLNGPSTSDGFALLCSRRFSPADSNYDMTIDSASLPCVVLCILVTYLRLSQDLDVILGSPTCHAKIDTYFQVPTSPDHPTQRCAPTRAWCTIIYLMCTGTSEKLFIISSLTDTLPSLHN